MNLRPPSRRTRWDRAFLAVGGLTLAEVALNDTLRNATLALHGAFAHHPTAIAVLLVIAWITSGRFRGWLRPPCAGPTPAPGGTAVTPATSPPSPVRRHDIAVRASASRSDGSAGAARLCTMGPEHANLYARVDPLTRTRFVFGERFVLCGGACGRAYKLATCEHLEYVCPVDRSSLSVP